MSPTPAAQGGDSPAKRQKTSISGEPLLTGIPDHVSHLILSLLPPSLLYSVSHSWRRVLFTQPLLSLYTITLSSKTNSLSLLCYEPVSSTWDVNLPPPPERSVVFRNPSFVSRYLPVQTASVSGNLVIFAATADNLSPAFPRPLVFTPRLGSWSFGPQLLSPRRWCAGGACAGKLVVASGVGVQYTTRTARSVEKLDFGGKNSTTDYNWRWERLGNLESERLSRGAMGAVGWREKLLVADVTANEGVMYDTRSDTWHDMPDGMIGGWKGPAASMDEETLYVVDELRGVLKRYIAERDCWEDVLWAKELRGAEQIAAGGGRVCIIRGSGGGIMVVDVVASPARFWIMDTPDGSHPIAVHILPRISQSDL